jgi:copper chaperone
MTTETHIVFNVPGVSCNHCKMAIEGAVGGVAGVAQAQVDVVEKSVDVVFDPGQTSIDTIKAAIVAEGYEVAGEHAFGD